ncbi:MAG: cbb3-type cytochrome c oxidase subunit 3 [Pseudomonadota bacterium]
MSLYEVLRHIADSYGLVVIFALYLALCLWAFRPGSKLRNRDAAHSIFKDNEDG